MNPSGILYCKLSIGLCVVGAALGITFLVFGILRTRFDMVAVGASLTFFGAWLATIIVLVLREPHGITGWKKKVVPGILEKSFQDDFLFEKARGSTSRVHAAKRFAIFCAVSCFFIAFWHFEYIAWSLVIGAFAALAFDYIVRALENRKK